MTVPLQSGAVAFQPRARLLKLIGSELISDDVVAITELVKNSHDADARTVTISFRGVGEPGGEIVVQDDGHGMSLEDLHQRWMAPAGSNKGAGRKRKTPKGRRMLGEKGVGRFAVDRLGSHLELISRRGVRAREVRAVFDWDAFGNDGDLLSDVESHWEERHSVDLSRPGTILRIGNLRSAWNERMFRKLSNRLGRLKSPFGGDDSFAIKIESDEFPDYSGEIRTEFLDLSPYRIDAEFDGNETITTRAPGKKPELHRWNESGALSCGPVRIRIHAFDLETEAVARIGPRMEARAWLRAWSGVSVYRDGFRVWPYGEPHDDWLRLDQRRVNNPSVRLSNNQLVGFVEITSDENQGLRDQTNREGLNHNQAFEDLRRLIKTVLQIIEADRQLVRHPTAPAGGKRDRGSRNKRGAKKTSTNGLEKEFLELEARLSGKNRQRVKQLARKVEEQERRAEEKRNEIIRHYTELASLGQASVGMADFAGPLFEEIEESAAKLKKWLSGTGSRDEKRSLDAMVERIVMLEQRLSMITPKAGSGNRRRTIDVVAELERLPVKFRPLLDSSEAQMEFETDGSRLLRIDMRPEVFAQLMHILISNSIEFAGRKARPMIKVSVSAVDGDCQLIFSDRGRGISKSDADRVFAVGFSLKEGGRGMGLAIARDIVTTHSGTIEVLRDGRRKGANILIRLPRKRARATQRG